MYKPPNEHWPTLEEVRSDPDYKKVLKDGCLGFKIMTKNKIINVRSRGYSNAYYLNYIVIFHIEFLRIHQELMDNPGIKRIFTHFQSLLQKFPTLKEYRECVIRELDPDYYIKLRKITHRKWIILKASIKLLSLHQRAVVTANHPDRLKLAGAFEL